MKKRRTFVWSVEKIGQGGGPFKKSFGRKYRRGRERRTGEKKPFGKGKEKDSFWAGKKWGREEERKKRQSL